jgi:hypothetical protein
LITNYKDKLNEYYDENHYHAYWNKMVYESPEQLIFWFDFIGEGEL